MIVREATQGACRFDDFLRALGIARNILTTRLERLVELGILERFPLPDRANTNGYTFDAVLSESIFTLGDETGSWA